MHARGVARPLERPLFRALFTIAIVVVWAACAPRFIAGRGANDFFDGDRATTEALARGVAEHVSAPGARERALHTGSARFDGEWALVTYQMAALGFGQLALAHPDRRDLYLPLIELCIERLLEPEATAFGAEAWGERGLDHLESANGHAYLGYVNLAIGMLRLLDPKTRFADTHDRLTSALARRLGAAPHGLIATYPGEMYPADVASVVGSLGLYDRATGADHRALLDRAARLYRDRYVDARSGLLAQVTVASTGAPAGPARASGTAIAVYFLSFAAPASPAVGALSSDLFAALRSHQSASFLGFGGVREYAPGESGSGDIDSGPVLFGVSVSATGFALSGARIYGDRDLFTSLYRTAHLFGVPVGRSGGGQHFMSGGALGNAILLAMLTATPAARAGDAHDAHEDAHGAHKKDANDAHKLEIQ